MGLMTVFCSEFSRGIVEKVMQMATSVGTPLATKVELVAVFRHMHSDVDTTMRVFK